jgi:hypothetical protein
VFNNEPNDKKLGESAMNADLSKFGKQGGLSSNTSVANVHNSDLLLLSKGYG